MKRFFATALLGALGAALVGAQPAAAQAPYGYPSPYGGCSGGGYGGYAQQSGYGYAPSPARCYGGYYQAAPACDYSRGYGYGGYAPQPAYSYYPPPFYNRSDVNVYFDERRRFFPPAPAIGTRGPS